MELPGSGVFIVGDDSDVLLRGSELSDPHMWGHAPWWRLLMLHGCASVLALIPSPLPAPKFANVIKQQGRFHLIMVMITHTNTARESNLINFNFRGLEPVLMQLFITQREQNRGLAAEVFNAGHKLKHRVVFQAPKAAIPEQNPTDPIPGT